MTGSTYQQISQCWLHFARFFCFQLDSLSSNMSQEIDSIFSKSKRKPSDVGKNTTKVSKGIPANVFKKQETETSKSKRLKTRPSGTSDDPFAMAGMDRIGSTELTEEGWKIYTPEELNIGKGGETELCPFDCDCCF